MSDEFFDSVRADLDDLAEREDYKPTWQDRYVWKYFYTPREVLWPTFGCKQCVGQEYGQGCYCAYHGAWDVDWPWVPRLAQVLRHVYVWWTGYDPDSWRK